MSTSLRRSTTAFMTAGLVCVVLGGCEPGVTGPARPCDEIDETAFRAAVAKGAARGSATIHANGTVMLEASGIEHCSTTKGIRKVCRRPFDFVIRYTLADGSIRYVKVTKGMRYRYNIHAKPTTCEAIGDN